VFMTPSGRVFHAGTYYPPRPRQGLPSLRQLLGAVDEAWRDRRAEVETSSLRIAEGVAVQRPSPGDLVEPPSRDDLARAVELVCRDVDDVHGGFGGAPKFPPSMVLEWLLRHTSRVGTDAPDGALALQVAEATLRGMAASGTYDQVEGGFARYSVDAAWVVPHFEKMLYDNAQLARVYLHWWRLTGAALGARIALETCDFLLHRLATAAGGFASALDADTPDRAGGRGIEGLTYVWTPDQLVDALGVDDAAWWRQAGSVTDEGTFEHGTSTLQLHADVDGPGAEPADVAAWARGRAALQRVRATRPQPARDDKVVAAWNGLAVAALAECGALLDRPDLVEAARAAAGLLLEVHLVDGRLRRVSRDGVVGSPSGQLEDHGDVVEGLLALYAVTGEARWVDGARVVVDQLITRFALPDDRLSDTPLDDVDPVLHTASGDRQRPADPGDNAYPSGPSSAAGALLAWVSLSSDTRVLPVVDSALDAVRRLAASAPRFAGWGLAVAEALVDGPREVVVVGASTDPLAAVLHREALRGTAPGLVIALGRPGGPPQVDLLEGRVDATAGGRQARAWTCRAMVCDLPTSDVEVLRAFTRPSG
jgi:uncharacterized protein YyaL (SSP411 family)